MYLTVTLPDLRTWEAYWYGYGELVLEYLEDDCHHVFVVDYGDDTYRAQCQSDRFSSGLYFATLTEKEDRSAGRWCEVCQQHGGHHTDRHNNG